MWQSSHGQSYHRRQGFRSWRNVALDGSPSQKWGLYMWRNPHCKKVCPYICPVLCNVSIKEFFMHFCMQTSFQWLMKYYVLFPGRSSPDVREWTVFLGQQLVNGSEVFEISLSVVRIIISQLPGVNIALLQLGKPVTFRDHIQPVCMDVNNDRSFPTGTQCWVAGWENDSKGRGKSLKSF